MYKGRWRLAVFILTLLLTTSILLAQSEDIGYIKNRNLISNSGLVLQPVSRTIDLSGMSVPVQQSDIGVDTVGQWQTIFTEDFEGSWPGPWYVVDTDPDNDEDTWAPVTCGPTPASGAYSCWCAGSGDMTSCGNYDDYQYAWMVYGPFSLADCNDAEVWFKMMNDSESVYDSLSWMASIDGSNFHGNLVDGTTSDYPDTWIDTEFDLTDVYTLGNLCGQQDVWVAFIFESDLNITNGGAYLDDIEIRRSVQDVNLPDLTPFQVPGWDDTLVVSNVIGTTTSAAAVYDDQTVYIDYSCLNAGVADANAFSYGLWVDDVHRKYVDISNGLQVNQYSYVLDSNLGVLDAGWHTIEIRCDYDDQVVESDELNNNYSRQVYIHPRNPNGEIHGFKWNDNNENGLWDTEEQALPNWTIYLDLNENCQLDPNESSSVTDADGAYHFTGLDAGTYVVAEIADANCPQIYPAHAVLSTPADSLSSQQQAQIAYQIQDSPPHPPEGSIRPSMSMMSMSMMSMTGTMFQTAYMLSDVPTSTWTYGCSATAAGMIFGYYDRTGYSNMYTGSTNGGICPLTDLGQGDDVQVPISGACSIIATQNGFDGRVTDGHVDDYWISYNSAGPDPWESGGTEHTWGECTADYMGTNQWQWDTDLDGSLDSNIDGGTTFYYWTDGSKMYDFIPDTSYGTPQTALCHGLRLFAESRGYTVIENYNQLTDNQNANGFTFDDFQSEIDAGRPVLVHVEGHTMTGVGYDDDTNEIYLHDTWDNDVHTMAWGSSYSGMAMVAVSVIVLEDPACSGTHTVTLGLDEVVENINFGNHCPGCGDWGYFAADINKDCYVDLGDLAMMSMQWLRCSHPDDLTCTLP